MLRYLFEAQMLARIVLLTVVATLCGAALAQSTAPTQPATGQALPEGPLKITVTGVEGIVQVRLAPGQPWQKVTEGMNLEEGAEIRTGPKSAVRFTIGTDQVVTLDRLGTVQILRANFEGGKDITDLGMKYGRTRYDIEAAGREHDAKVRSPNSVLAVRGTKVSLYDQPPFAPQAVSLTGRAMFRDFKRQTSFGGTSKAKITEGDGSAAQTALVATNVDPETDFSGRTSTENQLGLTLGSFSGPEYRDLTLFSRIGVPFTSTIGTLPNQASVDFKALWINPGSDVNLIVRSPLGDLVTIANIDNPSPSGGFYLQNQFGTELDTSFLDQVNWPSNAPSGLYTAQATLVSGPRADVRLFGTTFGPDLSSPQQFPPSTEPLDLPTTALTPARPTVTLQVNVTGQPPRGQAAKAPPKKPSGRKTRR